MLLERGLTGTQEMPPKSPIRFNVIDVSGREHIPAHLLFRVMMSKACSHTCYTTTKQQPSPTTSYQNRTNGENWKGGAPLLFEDREEADTRKGSPVMAIHGALVPVLIICLVDAIHGYPAMAYILALLTLSLTNNDARRTGARPIMRVSKA